MRRLCRLGCALLALAAAPAEAQKVFDSEGGAPIVIERGPPGGGVVVHVGGLEIHSGGRTIDFSEVENSEFGAADAPGGGGVTIALTVNPAPARAGDDAQRIAQLTGLLQQLNVAASRQCEPVAAVFGKPCRMTATDLRVNFRANFGLPTRVGANANLRFDLGPRDHKPN